MNLLDRRSASIEAFRCTTSLYILVSFSFVSIKVTPLCVLVVQLLKLPSRTAAEPPFHGPCSSSPCLMSDEDTHDTRDLTYLHLNSLLLPVIFDALTISFGVYRSCIRFLEFLHPSARQSFKFTCTGPRRLTKAIVYISHTSNVNHTPNGFAYHNAVPKNEIVEPQYIGLSVTLNGNPVTRSLIRIPK